MHTVLCILIEILSRTKKAFSDFRFGNFFSRFQWRHGKHGGERVKRCDRSRERDLYRNRVPHTIKAPDIGGCVWVGGCGGGGAALGRVREGGGAKNKNKEQCTNYRPISLLSCVGKTLDKCVHRHVSNYLNTNQIITPSQSGFTPKDSTVYSY